jgi:hypothetical protein
MAISGQTGEVDSTGENDSQDEQDEADVAEPGPTPSVESVTQTDAEVIEVDGTDVEVDGVDAPAQPAEELESKPDTPSSTTTLSSDGPASATRVDRPAVSSRRKLLVGALLAVVVGLTAGWSVAEAVEIRGQLVEGTMLTPEAYLAQVVPIEVDGVEHRHTLAELGWTTQVTDAVTGRPFARQRLHTPVGLSGGPVESPIVVEYRSELERDPTVPVIDAAWKVVEGRPGVATDVTIEGSWPPQRIVVSTVAVEPESSAPLQWFVHQYNRDADGWEIKLLDEDGTQGASLHPEEVAAHIRFDRQSATVSIVDEAGFKALLEERLRPFARGGQRGRFEIEATDDGATPMIRNGRLNVLDTLTEPLPGKVPDVDGAWADLIDTVPSFGRVVAVQLVDAGDLYNGVDPAALAVKLAESRTPNTGGSRMTNIRNVLGLTRGIVVEPGGVFGINQTTGRRSAAKGFVLAGAILNGEHVDAFGGGVSQTATMFYQAGYMAGLTFPEREGGGVGGGHQAFGHSEYFGRYDNYYAEGWGLDGRMDTGRLGRGVEQTVNWPNREAGFINTTPYPILVWTFDTGNQVGVSLWSLERTRFGVYEGTDSWRQGSCIGWIHNRTVYDMDDNVMFEDSFTGFYRTAGPTC